MKVIIVGGGPVGLVAAHAFHRLNIDFEVLESRSSVVIDAGSNLVLLPGGMRPLYQLGLEEAIVAATTALGPFQRIDHDGHDLGSVYLNEYLDRFVGALPRVISRHDLTRILYESLPAEAQAKIIPGKRASTVTTDPDTGLVTVNCRDGSAHTGTLIVGADGAHSLIREQMRLLALAASTNSESEKQEDVNEEKPYLTTYQSVWFRYPASRFPELKAGDARETHGHGCTTQLFHGEEAGVIAVYELLPEPTRERVRYTKEDEEALIARWAHMVMVNGSNSDVTLGQMWAGKIESGIVSLEEGVLNHWSWDGRIVLAGDAAHKFTPSTGAGCNNGIMDVVVLANELAKAVSDKKQEQEVSKANVAAALERYQTARYESVVAGCEQAGQATAMAAWGNKTLRFVDTWVIPLRIVQSRMLRKAAEKSSKAPAFDFVPGVESIVGEVPWARPIQKTVPGVGA